MKKFLMMLAVLALMAALLTSCFSQGDDNGDSSGSDNNGGSSDGGGSDSSGSNNEDEGNEDTDYGDSTVIFRDDEVSIFTVNSVAKDKAGVLREKLESWTGKTVKFLNPLAYPTDHDIIVGYIEDRPESVNAYKLFDKMDKESYFMGRYLIYAENGHIVIAYDENEVSNLSALDYAIEYIVANCFNQDYLAYGKGIVKSDTVDLIYEQEEIDKELVGLAWDKLREQVGDDLANALFKYYSLYTDSLVDWLANLYAPGKMDIKNGVWAGGFYGAASGRDTEGYGPDITCTRQVLSLLESTGMFNNLEGSYARYLPESIKNEIIYMLKTLQDPNGYFYHPQYDKETMEANNDTQRRGRDLSAAIALMEEFGVRPTYDTPSGVKGDGMDANGNPVGKRTSSTSSLGGDISDAVSKVVLASEATLAATDEYISSHDAFAEYLETKVKINENSYVWGNQLNAVNSQIRSASGKLGKCTDTSKPYYGKTLVDMLIDFLNERIDPTTGMWEPTTKFAATNGFYKVMTVYNSCKRSFPEPAKAVNGLIAGLLGDQKSTGNICDVYNLWVGLGELRSNVKNYCDLPEAEKNAVLKTIEDAMKNNGAEAILNSYNKYLPYRYNNGSFSDNVGSAATHHNGLPVSLGLAEGDTNATAIATGVVSQIYNAFGISAYKVPLYTESDWMRFVDIILKLGPVIKYSYLSDNIEVDFESCDLGPIAEDEGVSFSSGGVSEAYIIEENEYNNYLKFVKTGVDQSGSVLVYGSRTMKRCDTVTINFKMRVDSANSGRISFNILHYNKSTNLQTIYFKGTGKTVQYESTAGWIETGAAMQEWFDVKVVYYEGGDTLPMFTKVYVNGVLLDIKTTVKTALSAQVVGALRLIPLYAFTGTVLLDNVSITRTVETHDMTEEPVAPPTPVDPNPDTPTPEEPKYDYSTTGGVHDFESVTPAEIPTGSKNDEFAFSSGGVSTAAFVTEGENKILKFTKTGTDASGSIDLRFGAADAATKTVKISFKAKVDSTSSGRIGLAMHDYGNKRLLRTFFTSSGKYVQLETASGWAFSGAMVGEWFDVDLLYSKDGDMVYYGVSVNGNLVDAKRSVENDLSPADIDDLNLTPLFAWTGTMYMDDVKIERLDVAVDPDDQPKPSIPEYPSAGGTEEPENPGTEEPENPDTPTPEEPKYDYSTTGGVHDFESVTPAEIPTGSKNDEFAFSSGGVSTAAFVTEGENKILKFTKTGTDASGSIDLRFGAADASTKTVKISFKVKIDSSNSGRIGFSMYDYGNKRLQRSFFTSSGKNVQYEASSGWIYSGAQVGEWFDVELLFSKDGSTVYYGVSVNGKLIDAKSKVENDLNPVDIDNLNLTPLFAWSGTMYLDDVKIERSNVAIDPDAQPAPVVPELPGANTPAEPETPTPEQPENPENPDTPTPEEPENPDVNEGEDSDEPYGTEGGVYTFDQLQTGDIENKFKADGFYFTDGGVSSAAIVEDGDGKCLKFVKTAKQASGSVELKFENDVPDATVATATFRMKIANGSNRIAFDIVSSAQSKKATSIYFRADGTAVQIDHGGWQSVGVKTGEWFEIKLVYSKDSTGAISLEVLVNDNSVATITSFANAIDVVSFDTVRLIPLYDWLGTLYIDDVSLIHSK